MAAVLLPVVLALVGCLVAAATNDRDLVLRNNGFAAETVPLSQGRTVCQLRLLPSEGFDGVRFAVSGKGTAVGPAVDVEARQAGRPVATGRLPGGYRGYDRRRVRLDRNVAGGRNVRVCFRSAGQGVASLYGDRSGARGPDVRVGGRGRVLTLQVDLTREPRSALSMIGTILSRASVLWPAPVSPLLFCLLAACVAIAAPLLLVAAARAAAEDDQRT